MKAQCGSFVCLWIECQCFIQIIMRKLEGIFLPKLTAFLFINFDEWYSSFYSGNPVRDSPSSLYEGDGLLGCAGSHPFNKIKRFKIIFQLSPFCLRLQDEGLLAGGQQPLAAARPLGPPPLRRYSRPAADMINVAPASCYAGNGENNQTWRMFEL